MDAELSPTPEVLARISELENKPMDSREIRKSRKDSNQQMRADIDRNGIAVPNFKAIALEYYGADCEKNAPADFWERLIYYGNPSYNLQFDDPKHQVYYAVAMVKEKADGQIIFANDDFFYFDNIRWQKIDRRFFGLKLREFALEMNFSHFVMSNYQGIDNLLKQAEYELFTTIEPPKGLLNFRNGTYDTERDEFREHRKEDYLQYVLPYDYNPDAKCPLWDKAMKDWVADDVAVVLQELIGYTFLDSRHEKIGMLIGAGLNGKSVCLEAVTEALGRENITNFSLAQVTDEMGICRASMEGRLLNMSMDNSQKIADSAVFKDYVTGAALSMKRLYKQPYTSANYPKTILAMNALPITDDFSNGFYRRLLIIPFDNQIPAAKIDTDLKNKLKSESAGILNWIIEGARRLRTNERFSDSPTINKMITEYRRESDVVACYVDEYNMKQTEVLNTPLSISYEDFTAWSRKCGYSAMGIRTYAKRLRGLKFRVEKVSGSVYVWMASEGIKDVQEDELPY